jgi:hypothetical protein
LSPAQLRGLAAALVALTQEMDIADEPAGMLFDDAPSSPRRADRGRRRTTPKSR